ncbi:hypothetical protein ACL02U_20040 [Streptomyces sp. MS06]
MRDDGVYVVPLSFPVVPRGTDRIRFQPTAAHTPQDVRTAAAAFREASAA